MQGGRAASFCRWHLRCGRGGILQQRRGGSLRWCRFSSREPCRQAPTSERVFCAPTTQATPTPTAPNPHGPGGVRYQVPLPLCRDGVSTKEQTNARDQPIHATRRDETHGLPGKMGTKNFPRRIHAHRSTGEKNRTEHITRTIMPDFPRTAAKEKHSGPVQHLQRAETQRLLGLLLVLLATYRCCQRPKQALQEHRMPKIQYQTEFPIETKTTTVTCTVSLDRTLPWSQQYYYVLS